MIPFTCGFKATACLSIAADHALPFMATVYPLLMAASSGTTLRVTEQKWSQSELMSSVAPGARPPPVGTPLGRGGTGERAAEKPRGNDATRSRRRGAETQGKVELLSTSVVFLIRCLVSERGHEPMKALK